MIFVVSMAAVNESAGKRAGVVGRAGALLFLFGLACGCDSGALLHLKAQDLGKGLRSVDGYCLELDADGEARFGRKYDLAQNPLPQTLGVVAQGRTNAQAILYALHRGLPLAHTRLKFVFRGGAVDFVLPATSCTRSATIRTANSQAVVY